ncbi:O-antigen ligase family protein [Haloferula sp. A504]|uniref:O-antigen ligase family protein n=1 Tax=Haloferula sp. A504 TaxID=3373601 RepID=UPI0031BC6677|nr:O-antigen ligase family protein [Verrucomicrobiaceae bacterium E54]
MKTVSVTLLATSFLLALVFGAQTAEWSWGPAFVALALAVGAGALVRGRGGWNGLAVAMLPAVGWILYRGATSDVMDFARADAMLVLAVVATAWVVSGLRPGNRAIPGLFVGLALVLAINLGVAVAQSQNPDFVWPYNHRPATGATGFFGHYNYFANFTLGVALLLAARGLFSRDHVGLKFLFVTVAVWSGAMVVVSGSRGGTVAMAVGIMALVGCAGVLAWRRKLWWSKIVMVAFPLLLVGGAVAGWALFSKVVEKRGGDGDMARLADNSARLEWIDLALRVAGDHPLTGGGSRAFSWERNRHWEVGDFSKGDENERFVHNELLQTVTDYGAVGAVLVLIPIGFVGWLALSRLFLGSEDDSEHLDAVAAGVLAAGAAVLVQANFSFVFHLLPSTMLLGLLFGLGALLMKKGPASCGVCAIGTGGVLGVCLLWLGVQASRSLHAVWPVIYADPSLLHSNPGAAVDRLEQASRWWSGHRFIEEAGNYSRRAAAAAASDEERQHWNRRAVEFYREAALEHPHHPGLALNAANALSELGRAEEADEAFERAIALQGGLEGAFAARYFHAKHIYGLWHRRWMEERRSEEALWQFLRVRQLLDEAKEQASWGNPEREEFRKQVEQSIGFLENARVRPRPPEPGATN